MSTLFVCVSCGATYRDVQSDGTLYFHTCAGIYDEATGQWMPRPDGRDENIALRADGRPLGIKAEGLGVKALSTGKAATPAWQQKLAAEAAKDE